LHGEDEFVVILKQLLLLLLETPYVYLSRLLIYL